MNNFDQSSTGLNIELSAFLDTDLSYIYFQEAFFTIKEGRKDFLVYCEGNFSDFEKEYFFTKKELLAAIMDYRGVPISSSRAKPIGTQMAPTRLTASKRRWRI